MGSVDLTAKMENAPQLKMREPKHESFGTFLYNKQEGTVMGRTGESWAKIGGFYLVFYSFLAAFFAVIMTVFYQTLDYGTPTYTPGQDGGSILKNVALGYRPLSPVVESTLIWVNRGNNKTMQHWITNLNEKVEPYLNKSTVSKKVKYVACDENTVLKENEVCDFNVGQFGAPCEKDNWGYKDGTPCVLLKLNKMINWVPDFYEKLDELPKEMPANLKNYITTESKKRVNETVPKHVWVSCEGKYAPDEDTLGEVSLLPQPFFPGWYYPYTNAEGYLSPLVALFIKAPTENIVINIECKAWAKNIEHNRGFRFGLIDFEVIVD